MSMRHKVVTKAIEHTESCEWKISESILRGTKTGKFIKTPFFDIPGVGKSNNDGGCGKWAIEIYPNGFNSSASGYFSIYLHCKTSVELISNISFKIASSKYKSKSKHTFTDYNSYYGFTKFIKRSDLFNPRQRHLKLKELTLICEFNYSILRKPKPSIVHVLPRLDSIPTKLDQCLLQNGQDFTDCYIIVEEKEIKVHKLVLYIRSPVFQRMFETSMKEKAEGRVVITDFTHEIVSSAIEFCYSGEIIDWKSKYSELLKFSDKYDITTLKEYLEQHLISTITIKNVCEYLAVADFTNALNLRHACIKFIATNLVFINSFNGFSSLDSDIIKEVFTFKNI